MYYDSIHLERSLDALKLKIYKSKPFGNCFFSSISRYFKLSNSNHISGRNIRHNVTSYIENNKDIRAVIKAYTGMSEREIINDLIELKKDKVYDIDIFDILPTIIATQYNIKVCIYTWIDGSCKQLTKKDKEIYLPIHGSKNINNEIHLLYSNLEHYDLLYPF